jgi:hypothetical protein
MRVVVRPGDAPLPPFETGLKNARRIRADIGREKGNERENISGRFMVQAIGLHQAALVETRAWPAGQRKVEGR